MVLIAVFRSFGNAGFPQLTGPADFPMPLELSHLEALSRETWLGTPPRSEEGSRVDGALTTQPRALSVPPVRSMTDRGIVPVEVLLGQLGQAQAVTC